MTANLDDENTFQGLEILDYIVIVVYFVFVLAVGLIVSSLFSETLSSMSKLVS